MIDCGCAAIEFTGEGAENAEEIILVGTLYLVMDEFENLKMTSPRLGVLAVGMIAAAPQ